MAGDVKVSGKVNNEEGKPAFLVAVIHGCNEAYRGCPAGYILAGKWHTGGGNAAKGECNSNYIEGEGYDGTTTPSAWMGLCVAQ